MNDQNRYVPAAGRRAFTAAYDPVMAVTMREHVWRSLLAERVLADLPRGGCVVDVGSGTGTFMVQLKTMRPDIEVTGIDGDPEVLRVARRKAAGDEIQWRQGLAGDLPLEDGSANVVVMSLLLHHLGTDAKGDAIREARRALKQDGKLHVADWGTPDRVTYPGFFALRLLDGFPNTKVHADGTLVDLIARSGFGDIETWKRLRTMWGSLELISCASILASE